MKNLIIIGLLTLSGSALAHPNATYRINQDDGVTVTFAYVESCPAVQGAMAGALRNLTFSEAALAVPYEFVSGFYVEKHIDDQEVYVSTDDQCVPSDPEISIPASRNTFAGYSLQRVSN